MSDAAEPCELLPWDSNWFGFTVAKVRGDLLTSERAREIEDWCRQKKVRCLYFLAQSNDKQTKQSAEEAGYQLVDIRLTFEREVAPPGTGRIIASIRKARQDDLPSVKRLARTEFHDTRFYFDSNIPVDRADALYERWVEQAMEDPATQQVLVSTDDRDQVTGFIVIRNDPITKQGNIGLLAIDSAFHRRGLGRQLVEAGLEEMVHRGANLVTVVTQARNIAAQRLYQGVGFITRSVYLYYHKWFNV
jgi:dTDP-4-amino-4,6-dideoxy-D-galactose acyltransferase